MLYTVAQPLRVGQVWQAVSPMGAPRSSKWPSMQALNAAGNTEVSAACLPRPVPACTKAWTPRPPGQRPVAPLLPNPGAEGALAWLKLRTAFMTASALISGTTASGGVCAAALSKLPHWHGSVRAPAAKEQQRLCLASSVRSQQQRHAWVGAPQTRPTTPAAHHQASAGTAV